MNRRARQFYLSKSNTRGSTSQNIIVNLSECFFFLYFLNLLSIIQKHLSQVSFFLRTNVCCADSTETVHSLSVTQMWGFWQTKPSMRQIWLVNPVWWEGQTVRPYVLMLLMLPTQTCAGPCHWPLSVILLPACKSYKAGGVKTTCLNSTHFAWPADSPQGRLIIE